MFSAILAILILFLTDIGRSKGLQFRPINKTVFWIFVVNFAILMILGACHVENPFIEFGQISTVFYFLYFIIIGVISLIENSLMALNRVKESHKGNIKFKTMVLNQKRFYSTGYPNTEPIEKLKINSTIDNVVFVDNKSILFLPSFRS